MGYTLSFDASIKIKASNKSGLLAHIARDITGKDLKHDNPNINPDLTPRNITFYFDQDAKEFKDCKKLSEISKSLEIRLATVKKPLRKDAVTVRPLILQLDPKYFAENDDRFDFRDMLDWACNTFGEQNIVGGSYHLDEKSPHLHLYFTPVTDDGRLSQKDWFKSPASLREMHNNFRSFMHDRGYEIDFDRRKPGKYAKRMSEHEYRDFSKLQEKLYDVDKRERNVAERESWLNLRIDDVNCDARKLSAYEDRLDAWADKLENEHNEMMKEMNEMLSELKNMKLTAEQQANNTEHARRMIDLKQRFGHLMQNKPDEPQISL